MHEFLPKESSIRVTQIKGRTTAKSVDSIDQLVLVLPNQPKPEVWRAIPEGDRLKDSLKKRTSGDVPALHARLSNKRQTLVVGAKVTTDTSPFELLTISRKLVAAATTEKAGTLGVLVVGFDRETEESVHNAVVAAALAAGFNLPSFKSKASPARIRSVRLLGMKDKIDLSRTIAEARGNNLARWLTVLPPNKLDAENYAAMTKELAAENGWQFKRYSTKELSKMGAGAFLAVAQGNDNDSASIVRLRYRPGAKPHTKNHKPDVSLVGKGIIFDTGGTNLKPFSSMLDMHGDMQGSAVALGTFLAITELQLPMAVDCWLAITENRTGPNAYKSQDVVTAANGKTIQSIHTDAEGRMVLADTLTFASRAKPKLMLDYATLTGSVVNAITTRYSGVFTNKSEWHPRLKRTGHNCGERVWPFPIGKEFLTDLKSDVADIMQCSPSASGDHILAGSFLAEFVEHKTPWIHVDLAASNHKGGLGHIPTEVTGFGVRYTLSLLSTNQFCRINRLSDDPSMADRFRGFLPVVVDVETGGFNSKTDALLEIAAVFVDFGDGGVLTRGQTVRYHVKPFEGANMEAASLAVNGIDPHHPLRPAIDERDALQRIFREVRQEIRNNGCSRAVLVGHNAAFDLNFLNEAIERSAIKRNPFHPFSCFDTATLCGVAFGQTVLARAVAAAGFEFDEAQAHSAAYDAEITADLFCEIVNRFQSVYASRNNRA